MARHVRFDQSEFLFDNEKSTTVLQIRRRLSKDAHVFALPPAEAPATHLPELPEVGDEFEGFRLCADLGKGGMARVFLARQGDLADRPVVMKIARDVWGEANLLAQLHHPNIVPVYSVHYQEPLQAFCMPYAGCTTFLDILHAVRGQPAVPTEGQFFCELIEQSLAFAGATCPDPMPPARSGAKFLDSGLHEISYVEGVLRLALQLADALVHAHARGIVHRDLKPANILLTDEGRPVLLDFNAAEDTKRPTNPADAYIAGTLPYMAPEHITALQGKAATIDARCDLYAFGVIMFELLTGRYPFKESDLSIRDLDILLAERQVIPPPLRPWNPAVAPALEAIVCRCLEADPELRYQTAGELKEDLERALSRRSLSMAAPTSA